MLARLLLLFTVIPIVELAILIPLGNWMGLWPTLALIVATGVVGAWLAKRQGIAAWRRITGDLKQGELPSDSLLDGLAVLIAGAFLVTPGALTDVAGMILLIPPARKPLKTYIRNRFQKSIESGDISFISFEHSDPFDGYDTGRPTDENGDVIDVTPSAEEEEASSSQNDWAATATDETSKLES